VYVHRDYHSRNLMVSQPNPGILDFQDAVHGPITYDLVSLLRDAYIEWDEPRQIDWAVRYWERARSAGLPVDADFGVFWRDFEWMGVQRQLKVLGIFAGSTIATAKQPTSTTCLACCATCAVPARVTALSIAPGASRRAPRRGPHESAS
jgi:hypothetical protein